MGVLCLEKEEQEEQEESCMPAWSEQQSPGSVPDTNPELSPVLAKHINHLLQRHREAFATKLGRTDRVTMKIKTGKARPC